MNVFDWSCDFELILNWRKLNEPELLKGMLKHLQKHFKLKAIILAFQKFVNF